MHTELFIIPAAVMLDFIFGDPRRLPHPARWIGALINAMEAILYPTVKSKLQERCAGCITAGAVSVVTGSGAWLCIQGAQTLNPGAGFAVSVLLAFYALSTRSLVEESSKVLRYLKTGDLPAARKALSMIVGRDTAALDEKAVVRATVETVAESITDGIVSPLFYLALGGPVAAMLFKAVSTMDSMIGHKNERYRYFGTCAARLDDSMNFIPARLTGLVLIPMVALLTGMDGCAAFKIALRDRKKHQSPNSAHSEAAVAGALGVQLGGGAFYDGEFIPRPCLGDEHAVLSYTAIARANTLAVGVSILTALLIVGAEAILR